MGTGAHGQKGFVETWASVFDWDKSLLPSVAGNPTRIDKLFDDLYVAPPLLTVSVAA